jgi:hypothetical protein
MRKYVISALIACTAASLTIASNHANAQDTLVVAKRLDIVENPNLPMSAWKAISSQEAQTIFSALGWTELRSAIQFVNALNLVNFGGSGEEHKGAIQAPPGYTVCHAVVPGGASITCGGTFAGSYRTADDPNSANIDGLHYYIVTPKARAFQGRCWSDGTIVVTFVQAALRSQFNCGQSGEVAFYYQ